jgi:fructose-1,6-bisphosphatase/sedoheptulose 1,7-bisphosphatase-like protein
MAFPSSMAVISCSPSPTFFAHPVIYKARLTICPIILILHISIQRSPLAVELLVFKIFNKPKNFINRFVNYNFFIRL